MTLHTWLAPSHIRHYPLTPVQPAFPLHLDMALNEQSSFQVAMRLEDADRQHVSVTVKGPPGWTLRVRRVGYVPVRHHNLPVGEDSDGVGYIPGYVPDPLFDDTTVHIPPGETHAFWITVRPSDAAVPGTYNIEVNILPEQGAVFSHIATLRLHPVTLQPRRDFHITHWFYVDALIDWYQTALFDARFWSVLPAYVRDVVAHGQDTLYVPVFTPPLDGVKRPSQLLRITPLAPDKYAFDWQDVKRYTDLAQRCGITHFEWSHFFTQWGAKYAPRIYESQGAEEKLLWPPDTPATSTTYRAFLAQFLPALHRFLEEETLCRRSFFHVSDEPHAEHLPQYQADRALLQDLAPWMQVMDALSDLSFATQGLTDMPIPSIRTALDFVAADVPAWCYYCCGPRGPYLNRLLDTPLAKIAMHGMLFYRWPFRGFLHWGYNYWYVSQTRDLLDPYTEQSGRAWGRGWAYGDPFVVYPGPDGPIDSMRWEVFGESLQDYALLQTLGVSREDEALAALHSFSDFPKWADWRHKLRVHLLTRA